MDAIQQHLTNISKEDCIPHDHKKYLIQLYNNGFRPKVIYDIGACVLHWTNFAKTLWPDAEYVVFDAFDKAVFLYENAGLKHHFGVLGDVDGKVVRFYQNDFLPGGNSYYREIGADNGRYFPINSFKECLVSTLDSIVSKKQFPLPDLVKIDVQGAEQDIVKGGINTLKHAQHLVIEMQHTNYNDGAPKFFETVPVVESLGFKCVAPLFCNNGPDGDYGFVRTN